jgi:predicted nucleic acid-binding protein
VTRCYLDTSALRHLLVQHPATDDVRLRVEAPRTIAATSQITVTELHRLGLRVPELTVQQVDAVLGNVDLVMLTAEQLRGAGLLPDLPSGTQLRSLDALHLQAAVDFGATEFVTSDRRQADAAVAVGLHVSLL